MQDVPVDNSPTYAELVAENSAMAIVLSRIRAALAEAQPTPTNTASTCASQIAAEMRTAVKFARLGGDKETADLIEDWERRLRTC